MRLERRLGAAALAVALAAAPASGAAPAVAARRRPPAHPGRQLIVVSAPRYRDAVATFRAYGTRRGRRRLRFGPWRAWIGRGGFAPPGRKREGDGRTPSGTYGFQFMFGVRANPGVRFGYRAVRPYDVWDDDPSSPRYNTWVNERRRRAGRAPEPMDQTPAYDYGVVIAYNTRRVPGLGSAIFLHVGSGPTIGCVAIPMRRLLEVLRWLNPARAPRIEMGVRARVPRPPRGGA